MDDLENGTNREVDGESSSSSSSCCNSNNSSYPPAVITVNNRLELVIQGKLKRTKTRYEPPKRRMEKVPLTMRKDEKTKGYFDPRVVSVGPYHHGKKELQMAEKIKPVVAQLFISSSGRDMDEFRSKVLEVVDDARSCYLEGSTDMYSDEEFAEMMLLDGLFVSTITESITPGNYLGARTIERELTKHLGRHDVMLLMTDIFFLLENQLPFLVLDLLMNLKSERNNLIEMMDELWDSVESRNSKRRDKKELKRLLKNRSLDKKQPLHYLEYFWLRHNLFSQTDHSTLESESTHRLFDIFYPFRSISDLKAKGIQARRSNDIPQRDIKFKSFFFFGVLEIPPLVLDPQFIINISNQIAYEWTPNNINNLPTMAYINSLKSLINSAEDVKELRSKNILFSTYSSDEEVLKMFHSIPTIVVDDFNIYDKAKMRIQTHCNSKAKTWIAELIHSYFSSPWTLIAFLAATGLVTLSFIQTYFTIFPRTNR